MSEPVVRVATLLIAAVGRARLYGADHKLTLATIDELLQALAPLLAQDHQVRLTVTGDELFADAGRVELTRSVQALVERLTEKGVGLVEFRRGVERAEVAALCGQLVDSQGTTIASQPHLLVGAAALKAGGTITDAVRGRGSPSGDDDNISDEALQMQQLESGLREHRQVRMRDAREIVFGLLSHLTHQENVFLNLAEVHGSHRATYLHSCNVSTLSMSFALSLGMDGEEAFELGAAALLHDVGKSLISNDILDKPGPLDEKEWELMRRHPVTGARLLMRQRDVPRIAVAVAYEHHMDYTGGGGYPQVSFTPSVHSQLVAVVDTFDAILGKRSYRNPSHVIHALGQLQTERGKRFLPALVDAWREFVMEQLAPAAVPLAR